MAWATLYRVLTEGGRIDFTGFKLGLGEHVDLREEQRYGWTSRVPEEYGRRESQNALIVGGSMVADVSISSKGSSSVGESLRTLLAEANPNAIGMVTAFLSMDGAEKFVSLVEAAGAVDIRAVVGLSGGVTNPDSIDALIDVGYRVRLAHHAGGLFHPKLLVGGDGFETEGVVTSPSCGYIGSANFTGAGLSRNLEVALTTRDGDLAASMATAFSETWTIGVRPSKKVLSEYRKTYLARLRARSAEDIDLLELTDTDSGTRQSPLITQSSCSGVWVGLQSVTGFNNQVEFPKAAAVAAGHLLGTTNGTVTIACSDGVVRSMGYGPYGNAMSRLNVPLDVPDVSWARKTRTGALLVHRDSSGVLNLEVVVGKALQELDDRSRAMGCWGKTSTRHYGWF